VKQPAEEHEVLAIVRSFLLGMERPDPAAKKNVERDLLSYFLTRKRVPFHSFKMDIAELSIRKLSADSAEVWVEGTGSVELPDGRVQVSDFTGPVRLVKREVWQVADFTVDGYPYADFIHLHPRGAGHIGPFDLETISIDSFPERQTILVRVRNQDSTVRELRGVEFKRGWRWKPGGFFAQSSVGIPPRGESDVLLYVPDLPGEKATLRIYYSDGLDLSRDVVQVTLGPSLNEERTQSTDEKGVAKDRPSEDLASD
jgi:hypothetical protein